MESIGYKVVAKANFEYYVMALDEEDALQAALQTFEEEEESRCQSPADVLNWTVEEYYE